MRFITIATLLILASCGQREIYGVDGDDGVGCYTETVSNGTNIICGDATAFVPNGTNGIDGDDGSFDGTLEYSEVCPEVQPSATYKETLVYLDGKYLAFLSASNYLDQRLVVLPEDVQFRTTDSRDIRFYIHDGQIVCGSM